MNHGTSPEPSEQDLRSALVVPGFEMPSTVTKHRSVVMTRGLQPEDLGVLDFLKLRDPRVPATKEQLAEEMQAHGWKMGKTRFDGCFKRLKAAGHIKHDCQHNPVTGRPEWRIQFFLEPANNDQYVAEGIRESLQVRGEMLVSGDTGPEGQPETPETGVSRGQSENQVSGDTVPYPRKPGIRQVDVPAGQGRNPENPPFGSHPPHPPEEVDTSSPYPLTSSSSEVPSQREEGVGELSPEDVQAAERFLQTMRQPWNAGRATARKCAPLLLRVMGEQGWPSVQTLSDIDRRLLERDLTKNPEGISRFSQVLPKRIADLALYEVLARRGRAGSSAAPSVPDVLREERTPTSRSLTELLEQMNKPCP